MLLLVENALDANTTGGYNTAVGYNSLKQTQQELQNNVAIGQNALAANTTGTNNCAVGHAALDAVNTTAAITLLWLSCFRCNYN